MIVDDNELWVDGKKVASGSQLIRTVSFSPDGKRLAWVEEKGRQRWVVVDGKRGPEHTNLLSTSTWFAFSPDGAHLAYVGNLDDKVALFLDGDIVSKERPGQQYGFSPDGKRFFYNIIDGDDYRWVVDDRPGALRYDGDVQGLGIVFSADSKRWATVGGKKGKVRIVIDDEEVGPPLRTSRALRWSTRGKLIVFAQDNDGIVLVRET